MKHLVKFLSGITITLFSLQSFAENKITVHVQTSEQSAAGIGYSVRGKQSGSPGKSHSGQGPINEKYLFGYRKNSALGPNILCGSLVLTESSSITLVTKGDKCESVLNR